MSDLLKDNLLLMTNVIITFCISFHWVFPETVQSTPAQKKPLFCMQGEVYDVLLGPAGSREDWPLQSSRWHHPPAPPPQHRACSTSHPPQRGTVEHFPCVSHPCLQLETHPAALTDFNQPLIQYIFLKYRLLQLYYMCDNFVDLWLDSLCLLVRP